MTFGSFLFKVMEKKDIRNWVDDTVKKLMMDVITEDIKNNVKLEIDKYPEDYWGLSGIVVKQWYNGKWMRCEEFFFHKYIKNPWQMVTDHWVSDMILDITNEVSKFLKEPGRKSW
jgi:hypothetical protein